MVAGALPIVFLEGSCVPSYILSGRLYFIILAAWLKKKTLFRTEFILFVYLFIPVNQFRKKAVRRPPWLRKLHMFFVIVMIFFQEVCLRGPERVLRVLRRSLLC